MSYFAWDDAFDVGVAAMNEEHKRLLSAMDQLYQRSEAGAPRTELLRLVDALAKLTAQHFANEERYMASIGYARLTTHRTIHQQLLEKLKEHRDAFVAGTPLGGAFFSFLRLWLSSHIKGVDQKYSPQALRKTG